MARVTRSRSRSRDFHREQQKPENRMLDPEKEMEERREKRQEQLKNDKRRQRKRERDAKRETRRIARQGEEGAEAPELTPHERQIRRRTRWIYALILLIVLFFLGRAAWRAVEVKAAETAALAREEELKEELEGLREELTRIESSEYIEEKARTELHMIFPGETLYLVNGRKPEELRK